MPYLVKKSVSALNVNGDSFVHPEGAVLSDWELADFIRDKIKEGSEHYRTLFEPLLEHEAHSYRVKATKAEGPRLVDGEQVDAPWDDYVGLHPTEITDRMRDADLDLVRQAKAFEAAGMNRDMITNYISPAEHEPFPEYDSRDIREILDKFAIMPAPAVLDAIAYERAHKNRPQIIDWDKETYDSGAESRAIAAQRGEQQSQQGSEQQPGRVLVPGGES